MPTARNLRPNPEPWVTQAIARNWERISNFVEDPALMPLQAAAKAKGRSLVITIEEYGCGAYGCVMPTLDESVVFKITTDESEAEFIEKVLPTIEPPEGIVDYFGILRLEGHHKNYPLYALWREEANKVGEMISSLPKGRQARVDDLMHYQKSASDQAWRDLKEAKSAKHLYAAALKRRDEALAMPAVHTIILGQAPTEEGSDPTVADIQDLYGADPALRLAALLARHEVCAQELADDPNAGTIGAALLNFLEQGILIGDVHSGNVGLVDREGDKLWAITDPGHVAVLGEPWRPAGAVVTVVVTESSTLEHKRRNGHAIYGSPQLLENPTDMTDEERRYRDAFLQTPTLAQFAGHPDHARIELVKPGHLRLQLAPFPGINTSLLETYHLVSMKPPGLRIIGEGSVSSGGRHGVTVDFQYEPTIDNPWRRNPSPVVKLDRDLVARMKKAPDDPKRFAEKIQKIAYDLARAGKGREDAVYLAYVLDELGTTVDRIGPTLVAMNHLKWLDLGTMQPITPAEGEAFARGNIEVGKQRYSAVLLVPGTMQGRRVVGAAAAPAAATTAGFRPDSRADAQRFLDTAAGIAAAGGGYFGSEKVYLASVTDALGTTVAAIQPALDAWNRAGWIELTRNDMPMPQYQDLIARSEMGDLGTTRVRHFIIAAPRPGIAPIRPAAPPPSAPAGAGGDITAGLNLTVTDIHTHRSLDHAAQRRSEFLQVNNQNAFLHLVKRAIDRIPAENYTPAPPPPDVIQRSFGETKVFLFAIRELIGMGMDDFASWCSICQRDGTIQFARIDLLGALNKRTVQKLQHDALSFGGGSDADCVIRGSVVIEGDGGEVTVGPHFEQEFRVAFDTAGGVHGYPYLSDVRKQLPQYSRQQFDAGLNELRRRHLYSLDTADGRHYKLTAEQTAGALREGNYLFTLISRRR